MSNDLKNLPLESAYGTASDQDYVNALHIYAPFPTASIGQDTPQCSQGRLSLSSSSSVNDSGSSSISAGQLGPWQDYSHQYSPAQVKIETPVFEDVDGSAGHIDQVHILDPLDPANGIRCIVPDAALHDIAYHIPQELSMPMSSAGVSGDAWSTSPSSASSTLAFSPFSNVFPTGMTGPESFRSSSSKPPATSVPSSYPMPDLRPRGNLAGPSMPPPSRSPVAPSPISTSTSSIGSVRDLYTTSTPDLMRHAYPGRNSLDHHPMSPRSPISRHPEPTTSLLTPSYGTPLPQPTSSMRPEHALPPALAPGPAGPPLQPTSLLHQIHAVDGQPVRPDIHARIDKGFFLYDADWTCYRRNYFSVACSYTLKPSLKNVPLYLDRSDATGNPVRIHGFAMSISAVVDDAGGKPIDLVQHTPKRDKGPQLRPDRVRLAPHPDGMLGAFPGAFTPGRIHHEYDNAVSKSKNEQETVAGFERIQFKSATANNGKRRAAQQYYHLVVDLFVDVGGALGPDSPWVKIAMRVSAPIVVRGRSPGHYQDDRRGSTTIIGRRPPGIDDFGVGVSHLPGPTHHGRGLPQPMALFGGPNSMLGGAAGYQANGLFTPSRTSPPSLGYRSLSRKSSWGYQSDQFLESSSPSQSERVLNQAYPSPPFDPQASLTRQSDGQVAGSISPSCRFDQEMQDCVGSYGADSRPLARTPDDMGMIDESGEAPSLPPPCIPWALGGSAVRDRIVSDRLRESDFFYRVSPTEEDLHSDMYTSL